MADTVRWKMAATLAVVGLAQFSKMDDGEERSSWIMSSRLWATLPPSGGKTKVTETRAARKA